jgi:hypothetical protein
MAEHFIAVEALLTFENTITRKTDKATFPILFSSSQDSAHLATDVSQAYEQSRGRSIPLLLSKLSKNRARNCKHRKEFQGSNGERHATHPHAHTRTHQHTQLDTPANHIPKTRLSQTSVSSLSRQDPLAKTNTSSPDDIKTFLNPALPPILSRFGMPQGTGVGVRRGHAGYITRKPLV